MSEYSVFLLEPDELLREAFLSVLEEKGYAVYPFAQALEAQSFVEKIEFQIAVIDNDLCGIKTADVISAVKKAHPFTSVIIIASELNRDQVMSLFNCGIAALLLKPVNIDELDGAFLKAKSEFIKNSDAGFLKEKIKKLEQERSELNRALKNAANQLPFARLSRSLIHEFKNSLTTISISSGFIDRSLEVKDSKIKKHLKLIEEGIRHANELALKLLGLGRSREEKVSLIGVVDATLEMFKADLDSAGIKIVKQLDEDIPDLVLDSSELRQVLINIVLNAREAMDKGGILTVKSYVKDNDTVIEIEDTGCGIDTADIDKLFLPNYTTKEKGSGIGLYVSKNIIENIGGRIEVESDLKKGSVFRVVIPYLNIRA